MKEEVIEMKDELDPEKVTLQNVISILLIKLGGEVIITPEDQEKLKDYVGHSVEILTKKQPHHYKLSLVSCAEEEEIIDEHLDVRTRH